MGVAGHLEAVRAVAAGEVGGIRDEAGTDARALVVGLDEEVLQLTDRAAAGRRREAHDRAVGGDGDPGTTGEHPGVREHEHLGVGEEGLGVAGVRQ